ncbi:MAG TPA: DinB family protein [Vicinamibacterales bacterium]|nr:DinB family protein [Vicinamibacterales bacterium]
MGRGAELEKALTTKADIIAALEKNGEEFARFLENLTPEQLAERVGFPPPIQPSTKSRFEMVLGAKEHEMHHRAKLMVVQRLIGIVPHLTRAREQMQAGQK